jgi:hypothetical protein
MMSLLKHCTATSSLEVTSMDTAFISAGAGITGVLLGVVLVWLKEYRVTRSKRRADIVYLAILVTSHLDRYASGCYDVASDDGTYCGQPAGDGEEYVTTTSAPDFVPQELEVEWKLLPGELLYPILRLPDQQEKLQRHLAGVTEYDSDYPNHSEYFWVRRRGYAELGLKAEELAQQLLALAGLPPETAQTEEWSREKGLRDVITLIDGQREKHRLRSLSSSMDLDLDFG